MIDLGVAVVIEDDADVRNLLDAVLQQAGFEVHSAATGRDGVDIARQRRARPTARLRSPRTGMGSSAT